MPEPPAEMELTVGEVDRLLASQHPDLRGPLERVAHGWDNDVFRLGEDLAVRLPRRLAAAELVVKEQRWLPQIAPMLPVRVPVPVAIGRPEGRYPWSWSVVPWFEGRPASEASPQERDVIAEQLAQVFTALHVPAPVDAPPNWARGVPLAERDEHVYAALAGEPHLRSLWTAGVTAPPWRRPAVWVHGDVHPGNLVLGHGRESGIAAVVDFGDLTAGDPAYDLACMWLTFTEHGRRRFRAALPEIYDDAVWLRARAWAAWFAHLLAGTRDPGNRRVGQHGLSGLAAER
ncbi:MULTISPECIES: aminoglycoside phosphotransferase family protein [unclassified Pseudactinotalea]|uniref:aminoglycoside phosphotransferase family protein n=1 Tax=unclassified Pseudactinotalea TaxID=2649176 RepID=UPI00128BD48E|nr:MULTISPECIES: aminoglycoside phosphotransferase family protein [unclassified Pseudactinotalea]MPV48585.1 phosphotransferase [Pseudactinotalea sp. HY160]QGH68557.1 phosphotransferase [Pseudactinotalea sp. HY158]